MRVLFLHPEDAPEHGPWVRERWDHVVDLGQASPDAYERWHELFQCPVTSSGFASLPPGPIRAALASGIGAIRDRHGIDWWEVLCDGYTQPLYELQGLRQLISSFVGYELFVSRACFHARALEVFSNRAVHISPSSFGAFARLKYFHRKLLRLSLTQIKQVITDKYDPEHKIRAVVASPRSTDGAPAILLPTAYVNVTRTALAYAKALPENKFLLVAARRSGWCSDLPPNVAQADLAAYFRPSRCSDDHEELALRVPHLKRQLTQDPLCRVVNLLQMFDRLEQDLRRWLAVRDAWLNVFDSEPLTSVLCCDGTNPYTLIPMLIAKQRGVPAILSHHGALDGHYLAKRNHADCVLAKGEMERDYLVHQCGIPHGQVLIGAPSLTTRATRGARSHIVFFSEDYEVSGARVDEFYRSVLPGLAKLAAENDKELVLKLHPAESVRDRHRIVKRTLLREQQCRLRILEGPLTEELMLNAWFAVAGISTTAVECAMRGVPVFLCSWLENWPYGYLDQFEKFGVGMKIELPGEIQRIPAILKRFKLCDPLALWNPITSECLDGVLHGGVPTATRAEMATAI